MTSETSKLYVSHLLSQALSNLKMTPLVNSVDIQVPDPEFGDYSTNVALVAAKKMGMNPGAVAEKLVEELKKLDTQHQCQEITAKGGFVNFKLKPEALAKNLQVILEQRDLYGANVSGQGKKIIFEYSSPNTNKPLHIGHTRNDVYGKACINLLKANGYKVVSCEIINDRGIHIMKSLLMYIKFGNNTTPQTEGIKPDHFVGNFYQMFAKKAAESPESETSLLAEAQDLLKKWEDGDAQVRETWKRMNEWFFEGVKQTYAKEGTEFDEVDFESDIYDKGRSLILQGVEEGIFQKEEDGSVSVDLTEKKLDKKYLLRKDGTTIYITQDLYLWDMRNKRHNPDLVFVTTAAEQSYHFKVLGELFKLLKYPWAENFRHLPYELVYLGKGKMSSRDGNSVSADELLTEVKDKVKALMATLEKHKASPADESLIETLAYGAIKYGYLKYEPNTRIYFDLDTTIALEGNTGIYIQYAHARIQSMLKKAEVVDAVITAPIYELSELDLMRLLLHYGEMVQLAAQEYKPNLLASYLYTLAGKFGTFYNEVSVLQEPNSQLKQFRLQLIAATAQVIKNGLFLLGIEAPDEM